MQLVLQKQFNHSIVTALLFSNLSLCEKERKLQQFVDENEERYDILCDNIYKLFLDKDSNAETNTLYLTIDGFSFISNSSIEQQLSCFPVLTINKYSPRCPDISMYVDIALNHFSYYCKFAKSTILSLQKSA